MAPVLLFSALLLLPLTAEAGLPRVAISIPTDQGLAAGLDAAEQCDVPGKLIVLPPLFFDISRVAKLPPVRFRIKSRRSRACRKGQKSGSKWWWKPRLTAVNQSEKEITERVDAFVKSVASPGSRSTRVDCGDRKNRCGDSRSDLRSGWCVWH